jgi:addiction module HigA family antidote
MPMTNPPHPGRHVKLDCLDPLDLSVTAGARALGVSRLTLSNLVNGKNGISPEMAIRLSKAFGGSAEVWLRMQMAYDLAQAEKRSARIKVKPLVPDRGATWDRGRLARPSMTRQGGESGQDARGPRGVGRAVAGVSRRPR